MVGMKKERAVGKGLGGVALEVGVMLIVGITCTEGGLKSLMIMPSVPSLPPPPPPALAVALFLLLFSDIV